MNSEAYVKDYLSYKEEGEDLSDVDFRFTPTGCRIYQPIDDEEGDKYDVMKSEVHPSLWNQFVEEFS